MLEIAHIPHLLLLAEAESARVRAQAREELLAFCPHLDEAIAVLGLSLSPEQAYIAHSLKLEHQRLSYEERFINLLQCPDEAMLLESALDTISQIQDSLFSYQPNGWLLDRLAMDYRATHIRPDATELARFLFRDRGLTGADRDYYNPLHSNLSYALIEGKGLPISLAAIFMLVGARLGLRIEGFNLPGHFLAQCSLHGSVLVFDCFRGGKVMDLPTLAGKTHLPLLQLFHLARNPPSSRTMVHRILRNLVTASFKQGHVEPTQLYSALLRVTQRTGRKERPHKADCNFPPGSLVRHCHLGYRGLVVDVDDRFQSTGSPGDPAGGNPAEGDLAREEREQPWYHILVDGTNFTTYAAQSSLARDGSAQEVSHPLVGLFFKLGGKGRYIRNDEPWFSPDQRD